MYQRGDQLVIEQFWQIVTIWQNWKMTNFQTRKCKSHIMSSTIVSMFNESMRGINLYFEIVSMKLLNDKKMLLVKNRITILNIRYPASIVTNRIFILIWFSQIRGIVIWSDKNGFSMFLIQMTRAGFEPPIFCFKGGYNNRSAIWSYFRL